MLNVSTECCIYNKYVITDFLPLSFKLATYPCNHCHVKKDNLKSDEDFDERLLEGIKADYQRVKEQGFSKEAKQAHHSVAEEPFFEIPVDQVCTELFFNDK